MFDYNKMIKRAIEFFPRWTDIRKRYKTSNGGNLLGSMLDETIKIEEAIQEYIDSYFLETYEGHENEVMAFSYMANIGKFENLNRLNVYYDIVSDGIESSKLLMVTTNVRLFNEDKYDEYIYYEDGKLFIKESLYNGNPLTIIIDDDTITEYHLTKYHVWNIFDEFATFVNTRRYENETNKELLDRILYITKNLPNGSESGLKHAIISELMHFDPDITMDDIKIERATPENLIKPYEEFESLLEKMMYVNRDVFKCKRWDFDFWTYEFESISYMPHKWNEVLSIYQNGIGHGNDLEVIISDAEDKTDATVTLYNKSLVAFEKYVHNKDIEYDIDFKLVKYNEILNKSNIKYKIKASELVDITNEDINLHIYESNKVKEIRRAEDIYSFGYNVTLNDRSVIPSNDLDWYKLRFSQKDNEPFKISYANVIHSNVNTKDTVFTQNLLKQIPGFMFNAEGEFISARDQKRITRANDFNTSEGLITVDNGIGLASNVISGNASLAVSDYSNMNMTVNYTCDPVDVPRALIKSKGIYWDENENLVIRGDYSIEDKVVEINLKANTFEFDIISSKIPGRVTVNVIDGGKELEPYIVDVGSTDGNKFKVEETLTPRDLKIIIHTLSFNNIVLGNFKYSNFMLEIKTEKNKVVLPENNIYKIPRTSNLHFNLTMGSGNKPVINSIVIGQNTDKIIYTTDFIKKESLCERIFKIKSYTDIELLKVKAIDEKIIEDAILKCTDNLYRTLYTSFKDEAKAYLKTVVKDLISTKPEEMTIITHEEWAVDELFKNLALEIYNNSIDLINILVPYKNKLFAVEQPYSTILSTVESRMTEFLNNTGQYFLSISQLPNDFYISELFPVIDNTKWYKVIMFIADDIMEVVSNLSTENLGDFIPGVEYKGGAYNNKAEIPYIRLDLSEYERVDSVVANGGKTHEFVESGKKYYNIILENGSKVSSITIEGIRNKEARKIPLVDMIAYNMPDFNITNDKILCSRLMDSVVISRKNPGGTPYNMLIKLSNSMVEGIKADKYEMKMPQHIGCRYGMHTLSSNDSPVHYQAFDYISFYPASSTIYEAINEYSSYMEHNRNIKLVNNFSPSLDMSKLLIYTIENVNKEEMNKYIIRFHDASTEQNDIYSLDSWCVGQHLIAIQNNIDLENDVSYSVNTYDINRREVLSTMINISDTYNINNNMVLDTSQFMVVPPEGMTIKYEEFNGSEKKEHLLKTEEIIIDANKFTKLVYSNIDTIFHLSKYRPENNYIKENINYRLLNNQGIIIWDNDIPVGTKFTIVYAIKKPVGFLLSIEDLYKAIKYDIKAYNKLGTEYISGMSDEEYYSISEFNNVESAELIHIECSNPTFEGVLKKRSAGTSNDLDAIQFKKISQNDLILIKSGYYYINGQEYFFYSGDESEDIINSQYYMKENIDISGGEITTYKPTNNFVNNTEMRLRGKAEIYNYDCKKDLKYGVSNLNTLTACDSINDWTFFAMTPKLVEGTNGLAINFKSSMPCSYAYLDITDALVDEEINYISLLATSDLIIYLGEEDSYLDIKFNRALDIKIAEEIPYDGSSLRIATMIKDPNQRYYLIVQGNGVLDDIIITTEKYDALNGHSKNIDLLGLDLLETKIQGTEYRLSIDDNKDYNPYEAALMSNGYIKTTSKLDWYITKLASFEKEKEFFTCVLNNVNVTQSYLNTGNIGGHIYTAPVYINNHSTVKRLIFKINDIEFDQMKGFSVNVYTSDTFDGNYIPVTNFKTNKGYIEGKALLQYVKLKIEMPANKIIDNIHIFAEYKSTAENVLKLPLNESGYIITKIYDLQETLDYRLKDLGINDVSNINDIELYIRASRDIDKLEIWYDWQRVHIKDDLTLREYLKFYNVRFMQMKIVVKNRKAYIKFDHLDVEVI